MTKRKPTTRTCEACGGDHTAKYPKNDPHFCSMRCAALHAVIESHYVWCDKHGDWYHTDDGCYDCDREGGGE